MSLKYHSIITFVILTVNLHRVVIAQGSSVYNEPRVNDYDNNDYVDSVSSKDDFDGNYIEEQPQQQRGKPQQLKGEQLQQVDVSQSTENKVDSDDCWLSLNADRLCDAMDNLDNEYEEVRQSYQQNMGETMDRQMLDELLSSRGAAHRAIHKFGGDSHQIPAGMNLGGYCMMRLPDSILFFHRMKLRNSTNFQVNFLHNDLLNMALIGRISLNDLHLLGAYERSATHNDPSVLFYRPSYGSLELLLKNVTYKMEAHLRMMSDRVTIELINSELAVNSDMLMTYFNENTTNVPEYTLKLESSNLEDFLQRLKTDLDLWMKDYFNDFLMYQDLPPGDHTQFQEYEKKKTIYLNEYVNYAINTIRQKIYDLDGSDVMLPKFTLLSVPNIILRLKDGVLRGLDTMYRRSVATGMKKGEVRSIDIIVGFSKLKMEYTFEAVLPNDMPPLTGMLMLSADEMTAHLAIFLVKEPGSLDLNFDFIQQMKPESLTIEGPANRLIANYKHLLENQLIALMSNVLIHNIKMLNTITRCSPLLYGHKDADLKQSQDTQSEKWYEI